LERVCTYEIPVDATIPLLVSSAKVQDTYRT
jgi:hypothetical protein